MERCHFLRRKLGQVELTCVISARNTWLKNLAMHALSKLLNDVDDFLCFEHIHLGLVLMGLACCCCDYSAGSLSVCAALDTYVMHTGPTAAIHTRPITP